MTHTLFRSLAEREEVMKKRLLWTPEKGWHQGYASVGPTPTGRIHIEVHCCGRGRRCGATIPEEKLLSGIGKGAI